MHTKLYKTDNANTIGHTLIIDGYSKKTKAFHYTEETGYDIKKEDIVFENITLPTMSFAYNIKRITFDESCALFEKIQRMVHVKLYLESFKMLDSRTFIIDDIFSLRRSGQTIEIKIELKEDIDINKSEFKNVKANIVITINEYYCKKCGERFNNIASNWSILNNHVVSMDMFDDENKLSLSFCVEQLESKSNKDEQGRMHLGDISLYYRRFKNKFVFKKDDLTLYSITNLNNSGSTYICKKNPTKIRNITFTYSCDNDMYTFRKDELTLLYFKEVFRYIFKEYRKELEYIFHDIKTIDEINKHRSSMIHYKEFDDLLEALDKLETLYFSQYESFFILYTTLYIKKRYNINNTALALLLKKFKYVRPDMMSKFKNMSDKEILKTLNLNNKDILLILKSSTYRNYLPFHFFIFNSIKDKNLCRQMFGANVYYTKKDQTIGSIKKFLKQYRKGKSDKMFINKVKDNYGILDDVVRLYNGFEKHAPEYEVDFSKGIRELHSTLSRDYCKIRKKNKNIPQNKKLKEVFKNAQFKDIEYKLAKDTHELIDVGSKMEICVGSYGQSAVNKNCYIVVGYEGETPVTCMEFRKTENKDSGFNFDAIQVKKKYNRRADKEEKEYLINLFKNNKIDVQYCYDLKEPREIQTMEVPIARDLAI